MKIFKQLLIILVVIIITTVGVKAGDKFLAGTADDGSGCPKGMIRVENSSGGFCMDKYEVSAGSDCPYDNPKNQADTRTNLDKNKCEPVSEKDKYPWRFISQDQAQAACAKAGKRLPTNEEWQQAALGTPDSVLEPRSRDCQTENNWSEQPGKTGGAENCVSSFGIYDAVGNVWEWVYGVVEDGKIEGKDLPLAGYVTSTNGHGFPGGTADKPDDNYNRDYFWIKEKGIRAIARGGYWNNKQEAGIYSAYVVVEPSYVGEGVGFRCVK